MSALGNDARGGATRAEAVRTLSEAWRRVPAGVALSQGVRINLVAGAYPESAVPNYWENRLGTRAAPIIVRAADGPGTARLATVNVFGCRHLACEGLDISAGGGDVLHFEACTHVLLRNTTVRGTGTIATYAVPQEALKVNQCQYVYVENCDISGVWDNAVDFVAVQYGHVVGSRIHRDVAARNVINTVRPALVDPARGDYRMVPVDGLPATPVAPAPSPAPQPVPVPPAPRVPLTAGFRAVAAATARSVTTFVVTFNRAVTGVTLDDFTLVRGRAAVSLDGGRITTTDGRTYTISNVPRTNLAGAYTLRLRTAATGIADAWSVGLAAPVTVSWRMTRTVRA